MKKELIYLALSNFKRLDRSVKKKIYLAVGFLSVFIILFLSITLYVGYKAINIVATKASETTLKEVTSTTCYNTLISKLDLNEWLTNKPEDNFIQISTACLGGEKSSSTNGG